ncbi:MAG: DUF2236 domain-containing protein, partial [Cytophagaceae bacterium]
MAFAITPTRTFTSTQLESYRQVGDPPADAVITSVVTEAGREGVGQLMRWLADTTNFDTTGQPEAIQQFFVDFAHLPTWA